MAQKNEKSEVVKTFYKTQESKLSGINVLTEDEVNNDCIERYAEFMKHAPISFIEKLKSDPVVLGCLVKKIEEKIQEKRKKEERATKEEIILPSQVYYG